MTFDAWSPIHSFSNHLIAVNIHKAIVLVLHYIIISTMPRVANSHKQKNKKFKGSKGAKKAVVKEKTKTKGIAKVRGKAKLTKIQRIKN